MDHWDRVCESSMEQFVVPQFIDVEDKIIGPITTRQFVIILAAGFITFIGFKLLTFGFFIVFAVLVLGPAALLAFIKINGQPFHLFLINLIQTLKLPPIRVWDKEIEVEIIKAKRRAGEEPTIPPLTKKELPSGSRLAELVLTVNTGGAYKGE